MTTTPPRSTTNQPALPLRFADRNGLAALPWFEIEHGELVLADKTIGPIIDVHTHYTLPSIRHDVLDMETETPDSDLLLSRCCAHHLDIYANQCFSPRELSEMKRELTLGALRRRGKRLHHGAPNLARDMRSMGIERTIVIGIDMGVISRHVKQTLEVGKKREDAVAFGSIHPRLPRRRQRFEEQLHQGARGIKIHPPNMFTRPDHPRLQPIYRWCGEENIPVFFHCGPAGIEPKYGGYCGQVRFYEEPIRNHPDTRFVLGHSGALQSTEAVALFRRYPNVWMDVSCLSLSQLREVLEEGDENRIMFGSDWPFYHPILPLAKVLIATEEQPKLRRKVLYENAVRLIESIGKPPSVLTRVIG